MTTYCLEMRSTANWDDVRYRAYTASTRRAEAFKANVPRIQFTDSGHGIVPVMREHHGRREPLISVLREHVDTAMSPAIAPKTKPRSYLQGIEDATEAVLKLSRTVQAYGMDCEVVQIDEAVDAIRALAARAPGGTP